MLELKIDHTARSYFYNKFDRVKIKLPSSNADTKSKFLDAPDPQPSEFVLLGSSFGTSITDDVVVFSNFLTVVSVSSIFIEPVSDLLLAPSANWEK